MKYKVGDSVSLKSCKSWEGYGFEESVVTKSWVSEDGTPKYSIKSSKGHTFSIVKEDRLKQLKQSTKVVELK
jgi:hypothetical protein